MWTEHKKCLWCGEIGHKEDMFPAMVYGFGSAHENWYHEQCFIEKHDCHKEIDIQGKLVWIKNEPRGC